MPEAEEQVADSSRELGAYLARAREAKGVSLDEASHVTKIGKTYLAAIEEGHFEKLPNAAYLKGFLRLYANYLGLSGDEMLSRYQESLAAARVQPADAHPEAATMPVERVKFGGHGRWAIPFMLLCLVILAALFLSEGDDKRPKAVVVPQPAPKTAPAPVQPVLSPRTSAQPAPQVKAEALPAPAPGSTPVPGAAPATASAPAAAPAAPRPENRHEGVVLKLRFTQDSWLNITIDDSISQRYDLKAGDLIEWKGSHSFTLDIGDGGAVEGEFNGKPLKALGEKGKPAHVELKE